MLYPPLSLIPVGKDERLAKELKTMLDWKRSITPVAALLLLAACASGGGGGSAPSVTDELGTFAPQDVAEKVPEYLRRNQFTLIRQEGPPTMLYETDWRPRAVFEDEASQGITQVESRVIVRGRERMGATAGGRMFTMNFMTENRVRVGQGDWQALPASDEFRAWARGLSRQLRVELETLRSR